MTKRRAQPTCHDWALTPGERVRIAHEHAHQFRRLDACRSGVVVRQRRDGLLVVRWDGLASEQVFAPALLERMKGQDGGHT
ncbi:MAG TPA: hypothetical protein VNK52_16250 [Hyphomicrobiaceae bacterium]|nr:hypothetical protein [Hyphomicrobiaceae bacterium]